jgi:hypothetical protein
MDRKTDESELQDIISSIHQNQFRLKDLEEIVGKNQNHGCGGDGSMSDRQWELARDIADILWKLKSATTRFLSTSKTPTINDRWNSYDFDIYRD